ncbi:MAG: nicotinate phosphoribosyltransferase [Clostridia bacterium]|nr:nicotinate phosphoribosyltransferase [Clostridia bacterium]
MKFNSHINLSMLTDFYEFTMSNGYFKSGMKDTEVAFDLFFRKIPNDGGYAIMAGLEQMIEYIKNLHFSEEDIAYLRTKNIFCEEFLEYLRDFKFSSSVWAIPEGTPIFPMEPVVCVKGPVIEAQLMETMLLLTVNHQSLIATKANRIVQAAEGRAVMEFGSRRAQGYDGAIYGARAAYIGGCAGTACTVTDQLFDIPALGTMAHSWVQMFDTELEAFLTYARNYPEDCTLLVDTYNVLKSGIPNAIKAFDTEVVPRGFRPKGIRIDSGDITYLSKKARKMLDDAGYPDVKIVASNSLDEYIIRDMLNQGAKVDTFGVGERLITSKSEPVFGGVYKLVSVFDGEKEIPKIKLSENVSKITIPGFKSLYRLYSNETGKAIADVITLHNETFDGVTEYELFDPQYTWKRQKVTNFTARKLLVPIFENGKQVYTSPTLKELKEYCKEEVNTLWDEVTRFENPHTYYVDLSQELWNIRDKMLQEHNS